MLGILMNRIRIGAIGAVLGLAGIAGAGAEARAEVLRWKFKAGEKIAYTMDQKTVSTMKIMGREVKTTLSQTINMHWDVKSLTDDGGARIFQTIDRFRTRIESPSVPFEFDTNDKKDPEGPVAATMVPLLRSMVGAEFSMKMAANGEMTDVKVPEGLLNTIKNAGPAGGKMFSEEGLKTMLSQSSLSFPNDSLEKGKGWTRQSKIPTPPVGTMVLEKKYTYQGPDPKNPALVSIDLATKVTLDPLADASVSIKITSQDGEGSFLFNSKTGRMVNSTVKDTMVMTISTMGQTLDQITETDTTMKLDK
jgi:hypothetical protein